MKGSQGLYLAAQQLLIFDMSPLASPPLEVATASKPALVPGEQ